MKRKLAFIAAAALLMTAGCGKINDPAAETEENTTVTEAETTTAEETSETAVETTAEPTAAAPETEKEIQPLMNCDSHNIILDCTALEYISSSGLRIFLSILKNAKAKGSHVYIRGISDSIRKVFTMTGFYNLFEFK